MLLWLLLLSAPLAAQDGDLSTAEVTLVVKPNICVAPRGEASCTSSMDIRWTSSRSGAYCLHSNRSAQPLFCWYGEASGQYLDRVKLSEDLHYRISVVDSRDWLASVTVKLAALKPHRRYPRRRNRLPWSIIQG